MMCKLCLNNTVWKKYEYIYAHCSTKQYINITYQKDMCLKREHTENQFFM